MDKQRARLNCITHLLNQVPYAEVPAAEVELPDREHHPDYKRDPLHEGMLVPQVY